MGIDTSSRVGSVAVIEKKRIIDEILSEKARSFSRSLLGMIEAILARNNLKLTDLYAIACAVGPGSFTGIRIGLSTIQGIAISTGVPVYGISTLQAMAAAATKDAAPLCPVIDAGKAGVYYALFENSERLLEDAFGTIEDAVGKSPENAVFFGDVSSGDKESLAGMSRRFDDSRMENSSAAGAALAAARTIAPERIANDKDEGGGLEHLRPNYIRKSYAEK